MLQWVGVPHRNCVAYKSVSGHLALRDDVNKDCFSLGHNIGAVSENYYPRDKFVGSRRFSNIYLKFSAKPIVPSFIFIIISSLLRRNPFSSGNQLRAASFPKRTASVIIWNAASFHKRVASCFQNTGIISLIDFRLLL